MESSTEQYECDGCGACCRSKLVDVYEIDTLRNPRIAEQMNPLREPGLDGEIGYLNCVSNGGCVFLRDDYRCGIYITRPSVCVLYEAGSDDCQECRRNAGIPFFEPISIAKA
jgi:hypothetical protein